MLQRCLLASLLTLLALSPSDALCSNPGVDTSSRYEQARVTKATHGHDAAVPLYRQLLREHPDDMTAASRLSAASGELLQCWVRGVGSSDRSLVVAVREWFRQSNYTAAGVKETLEITEPYARAPIYIHPAAPGSSQSVPFVDETTSTLTSLQLLVSLFLFGITIPNHRVSLVDQEKIGLLHDVGFVGRCEVDPTLWVPLVSIMPLDLRVDGVPDTLLLVTDWHPRVLNTIYVGGSREGDRQQQPKQQPVMYIGPDSLALVQHFLLDPQQLSSESSRALDVCAGSGIQALVYCRLSQHRTAIVADINPRALQFARWNAAWNGIADQIEAYAEVDLIENADALLRYGRFDLVLANPPFLPVPPSCLDRHGLFSAGGETGEVVLASILRMCPNILEDNGVLAMVSEFFLGDKNDSSELLGRFRSYWGEARGCRGLLLTNENPIGREEYAKRRGDVVTWTQHLEDRGIFACSPGLLYAKVDHSSHSWDHAIVPNSKRNGSVWTPWNYHAVAFTQRSSRRYFRS